MKCWAFLCLNGLLPPVICFIDFCFSSGVSPVLKKMSIGPNLFSKSKQSDLSVSDKPKTGLQAS